MVLVSISFVFVPLINFRDGIGHLTALFYKSTPPPDTKELATDYFYLQFIDSLGENDTICEEAIYNYDENSHVCKILKTSCVTNSVLIVCLLIGLISTLITIKLVRNMFMGKYFRYTNLIMLI